MTRNDITHEEAMEEWADATGREPDSGEAQQVLDTANLHATTPDQRDLIIRASGHLYAQRPILSENYCASVVGALMTHFMGTPSPLEHDPRAYAEEVDRRALYIVSLSNVLDALLLHFSAQWSNLPPVVRLALNTMKDHPAAIGSLIELTRTDAKYAVDYCEIRELQQWLLYRND